MVRKTQEEAAITKERIIQAAEECFCEYGIYLSSFDMVAKKAKCTRGAIYWHFKDKNELIYQVTLSFRWSLITELKELSAENENILKALVSIFKRCINDLSAESKLRHYLKLIIYRCDEAETYKPLQNSLSKFMRDFELLIKNTIHLALQKGEIPGGDMSTIIPNVILYSFYGAVRKFFIMNNSPKPLMEFIDILEHILIDFTVTKNEVSYEISD